MTRIDSQIMLRDDLRQSFDRGQDTAKLFGQHLQSAQEHQSISGLDREPPVPDASPAEWAHWKAAIYYEHCADNYHEEAARAEKAGDYAKAAEYYKKVAECQAAAAREFEAAANERRNRPR